MTDQKTAAPKAMWTRCTGCQDRIYNSPQDIKIHAQHCPYDLQMTIQKLTIAIFGTHEIPRGKEALVERLGGLEEVVGELDGEGTYDPDAVDENAYEETVSGESVAGATDLDDLADPDAVADAVAAFAQPAPVNPSGLYGAGGNVF